MKQKHILLLTAILLIISIGVAHQDTNHGERTADQIKNNHLQLLKNYDTNNNQTIEFQEVLQAIDDYDNQNIQEYQQNAVQEAFDKEITWSSDSEESSGSETVNLGEKTVVQQGENYVLSRGGSFEVTSIAGSVWIDENMPVAESNYNTINIDSTDYWVYNCGIESEEAEVVFSESEAEISEVCDFESSQEFRVPMMEKLSYGEGEMVPYGDYRVKEVSEGSVTWSTSVQIRDVNMGEYDTRAVSNNPNVLMYTCSVEQDSVNVVFRNIWGGGDRSTGNPQYVCNLDEQDSDNDGRPNSQDSCPYVAEGDHTDYDGDGIGYACDGYVLSCDAPHAAPNAGAIKVSGSLEPGENIRFNSGSSAPFVSSDLTQYEWFVDGAPYRSGDSLSSIGTTFEQTGEHSVTVKVTATCGGQRLYDSTTREFEVEELDFMRSGGFDHWDGDISTANNPRTVSMRSNYVYNRIELNADIGHKVQAVRVNPSFNNNQMNIYRFGYQLKNGSSFWIEETSQTGSIGIGEDKWNYIRFNETQKPIDKWLFGVYNGHDNERGRFSIKEIQPAVTERIESPEQPLELVPVSEPDSSGESYPFSYAIKQPRTVGNQRVNFGIGDWTVAVGGDLVNQDTGKSLSLEPEILVDGESLGEKDYARTYSTNPDFTDGLEIGPERRKTVRMHMDAEDLANDIGNGEKQFTMRVNGRSIDLGTVEVTNSSYMIRSINPSGELQRGSTVDITFSGNGVRSIAGGEISNPAIVIGTADRENIFATSSNLVRSSGSHFTIELTGLEIPAQVDGELVAAAVESGNAEERFRSGEGYSKTLLDSDNEEGEESNQDEDESNGETNTDTSDQISISVGSPPYTTGEEITITATSNQNLAQNGYKIQVSGPETYSETFNQQETEFSLTPEQSGEYTMKILPQVLGSNLPFVGNLLQGGSLEEKTITVTPPDQVKWKTYCAEKNYDTEQLSQQINCIEEDIIPEYFEESTGSSPEIGESLCQDLLGYSYSSEENSCMP